MEKRLRPKYYVVRVPEGKEEVISPIELPTGTVLSTDPENADSPFVLMPRKDPAAFVAMITYAQFCEPQLRAEIANWLIEIAKAPPLFGTQGARNWSAGRIRTINEV